jgi:hypothetical protein
MRLGCACINDGRPEVRKSGRSLELARPLFSRLALINETPDPGPRTPDGSRDWFHRTSP